MKSKNIYLTLLVSIYFYNLRAQNLINYSNLLISVIISPTHGQSNPQISVNLGKLDFTQSYIVGKTIYNVNYTFGNNQENSVPQYVGYDNVLQGIIKHMNTISYSLKSVNFHTLGGPIDSYDQYSKIYDLVFEKATSYREEELYKLLGELNLKIESTSKNYIDKAKTEINQNILEYLKGIPDEVLAKSFKDQLISNLSLEINEKLLKMKEEILLELKKP